MRPTNDVGGANFGPSIPSGTRISIQTPGFPAMGARRNESPSMGRS